MELDVEQLMKTEFKDVFDFETLKKSLGGSNLNDLEACCCICGNELKNLDIGFNEKEQVYRCECPDCGVLYVMRITPDSEEEIILQGEDRNWPEYLSETLKFPFFASLEEDDGRAFFYPDYEGPSLYDTVRVFDVHYSISCGVIAEVQKGSTFYAQPLCYLEGLDKHSFRELDKYKRWRKSYWSSDLFSALSGHDDE